MSAYIAPDYSIPTLSSAAYTPDEIGRMQVDKEAEALDNIGAFGRGLTRGMYQTPGALKYMAGQIAEPFAPQFAQNVFQSAAGDMTQAGQYFSQNDPRDYTQVHSIGDAVNLALGTKGEQVAHLPLDLMGGGLAARGLRGVAMPGMAKAILGAGAGAFPMQMGEGAQMVQDDPYIKANTTPLQRLGVAAGYAGMTAPMEGLGEGLLMGRAAGMSGKAVKSMVKGGLKEGAKDAAAHVAGAIPETAFTEGGTEALQQATQQAFQNKLNPNRDTSKDTHDLIDSFFKGWAGGLGSGVAGRGADVAWANGRDATDAVKGLIRDKLLPDNLKHSDDRSIVDWDNQDNEQRNSWAKDIADRIMNSDASQTMKDAAKSFYDKAASGAKNAWDSLSQPLRESETYQRGKDGLDDFFSAAKKTYGDLTKHNTEGTEDDKLMYDAFRGHLDPKGHAAQDAESSSKLYSAMKDSLLSGDYHELPLHSLVDQFGSGDKLVDAYEQMRGNLVRAGHDVSVTKDELAKQVRATVDDGQVGQRSKSDLVKSMVSLKHGDVSESDARELTRGITNTLASYSSLSSKQKAEFERGMKDTFGQNSEKVLAALRPKRDELLSTDESDDEGQPNPAYKTIHEVAPAKAHFVGSGTKGAGAVGTEQQASVKGHGGMWNLGVANKTTRAEIKARFKQAKADLMAQGHSVKALTPLEYAAAAGISPGKVAQALGTSVEKLKDHPARMLMVEPKEETDNAAVSTDQIKAISTATHAPTKHIQSKILDDETAGKVINALKLQGAPQRRAMEKLGLPHGYKLEETPKGWKLHNNFDHGNNGRMTVTTQDDTQHVVSAQELISHMRERGMKGSPYQLFTAGMAALHANPDVKNVGVKDIWGRDVKDPFAIKRGKDGKAENHFQLMPGLSLGYAHQKSFSSSKTATEVEEAQAHVDHLEEQLAEAEGDDTSEIEAQLDEAREVLAEAQKREDEFNGEGERPGVVENKSKEGVRTHDEATGAPLQPHGREVRGEGGGGKTTSVKAGSVIKYRPGVSAKNLTGQMRKTVASIRDAKGVLEAAGLPSSTLDVAADYVARAAAANRDGDVKARDAFTLMAQHRLFSALNNEMALIEAEGTDAGTSQERKDKLRAKYAQLLHMAKQWQAAAHAYEENSEAVQKHAVGYETFEKKGEQATEAEKTKYAADRYSHREEFMATLAGKSNEEIIADGKARAARLTQLEAIEKKSEKVEHLISMMREELSMGREELRNRKADTTAKVDTATKVEEGAKQEEAQAEQKEFDKLIDNMTAATKSAKEGAQKLKDAYKNVVDALKAGNFDNRQELVSNLRQAMSAFKDAAVSAGKAAGEAVSRLYKAVQAIIKQYREATPDTKTETKNNLEGSFANGKGITQDEMDAVRDYVEKTLGKDVAVAFDTAMKIGGSGSWTRDPKTQKALIKVAVNATNPLSKAHHEAMHEFFQRLMDNHPEAAEQLTTAANSPAVKRQIEQFFHNDPNYAKIKAQIDNDTHERVAYMFQLWAAGQLNVGPKTESWFSKVVTFIKNCFGVLSDSQRVEAIMQHFHDGQMSEPNAVVAVLAKNDKQLAKYMTTFGDVAHAAYDLAREVLITAQNELIDSKNSHLEKLGRMFSNETGAQDKDISFMSERVMNTNQMNDHLYRILRGADEKDVKAALKNLQTGQRSNDPKIARIEQRISTMLEHIYNYMKDAGVDIKHRKDYFPRAWDFTKIAENKQEFIDMLKKDYAAANNGAALDPVVAENIAMKLIEGKGADTITESEVRPGYSPFMANANKRVLDFVKSPEFAKFQKDDMVNILSNYIAGAVHRAEYTKRFGQNGDKLRSILMDAAGEAVGPEWATAKAKADADFKAINDVLKKQHGKDFAKIAEGLAKAGYDRGEVEIKHISKLLTGDAAKAFGDFNPQLHRSVKAIMAMEGTLGYDINPTLRKWQSGLIVYENMRLLWMSLFSQVIDPLGVVVNGGTMTDAYNTFKAGMAGTIAGWRGKPIESSAYDLAMKLGVIDAGNMLNSQAQAYNSIYMGEEAKKWNDRLFRINGVEGFSQGTRVGAMMAAINFIKFHGTKGNEHSERYLSELGLTKADVKVVGDKLDYNDPKIQKAIFRWVEGAILRPNAALRPSWSSDPHFALLFHMKQFTYTFQKVLLERVAHEVKHDNYDPMITMALTYVPAMIAADFLRGILSNGGQEPAWKRKWTVGDYLAEGVQRAGLLGVPQMALDTAKWGPAELGGPLMGQIAHAGHTMKKTHDRDVALDKKAEQTHSAKDQKAADDYNGTEKGLRRVMRDAMPMSEIGKRMVYDEVVGKG